MPLKYRSGYRFLFLLLLIVHISLVLRLSRHKCEPAYFISAMLILKCEPGFIPSLVGGSYQVMGKRNEEGVHPSQPTEWCTFCIAPGGKRFSPLKGWLGQSHLPGEKGISRRKEPLNSFFSLVVSVLSAGQSTTYICTSKFHNEPNRRRQSVTK